MQLKFFATAALAVVLIPGVASAQSKMAKDSSAQRTTSSVSNGEVAGPGADVTPAMLKAQEDPNIIGTPAWWKTHVTADGKPLSDARKW